MRPDAWTATFVGFVPANRPRLVISVVIDEPVIEHYGGTIAGPVFRRVAAEALRHLGVPPAEGGAKLSELVKTLRVEKDAQASATKATEVALAAGKEGAAGNAKTTTQLEAGSVEVPRLKGLGARGALVALRRAGLVASLSGSGIVAEQSPEAGAGLVRGSVVHVALKELGREPLPAKERTVAPSGTFAAVVAGEFEAIP